MHLTQKIVQNQIRRFLNYFLLVSFCLPLLTGCGSEKIIVNDLDEKDANEILVFLAARQINADKVKAEGGGNKGGTKWNIVVSSDESTEAMRLLNQQGLPRRRPQTILDLYSTSGLVPSDQQEKIKYQAALGEQLASNIRKYDGVLDAEVVISFPQEDPLNPGKTKGKITASVWVKHSGILDDPNSHLKSKIQRAIASSVTGLSYNDVTVVGEHSHLGEEIDGVGSRQEEKSFVSTWGIILGTESLTRFRIIFFSFSLLVLFLSLAIVWLIWKTSPLLKKHGGMKALLSLAPIGASKEKEGLKAAPAPPSESKEAKQEGSKKDGNKSEKSSSKDVDET